MSAGAPDRQRVYSRCPKCGHRPLPPDQAMPAACRVILAKVAQAARGSAAGRAPPRDTGTDETGLRG